MTNLPLMITRRIGVVIFSFWASLLVVTAVLSVAISVLVIAATLSVTASAKTASPTTVKRMVIEEALNSTVPPSLALAVARVESNFDASAQSHKGARGVMQIMPRTARDEFGVDEDELWDTRLNIQLGIGFLAQLIDRYKGRWDLALSHYNGGTISGTLANARVKPATRRYVQDVLRWQRRFAEQARMWNIETKPRDGWVPARTQVVRRDVKPRTAKGIAPASRKIVILRPSPPATETALARNAEQWPPLAHTGAGVDDFEPGFAQRLAQARKQLDDFGTIVIWTEG